MALDQSCSRKTATLLRQDTSTTVSSLSTSYSNLETSESNASTLKSNKRKSNRRKQREHSNEHFVLPPTTEALKTVKVHYYPEEQLWSFVVVAVAFVVHIIDHGLQLAYGIFLVMIFITFETTTTALSLTHAGE